MINDWTVWITHTFNVEDVHFLLLSKVYYINFKDSF